MSATEAQIAKLRRMIAEPTAATYTDDDLAEYIEAHPVIDAAGLRPYDEDGEANDDWTETYDLAAAAADIWGEKAAALASAYDVDADGADLKRSQLYAQAVRQEAHWKSRSVAASVTVRRDQRTEYYHGVEPDEVGSTNAVVNLPEDDDW